MVNIDNFFRKYGSENGVSYEELRRLVEAGTLQIVDEQTVFTMDEVASIVDKTKRTVNNWVESGKMKVYDDGDFSRVVTATELNRLLAELPVKKSHRCIYVKAESMEQARAFINSIKDTIDWDKYRSRSFIDIGGKTDGLLQLVRYMFRMKELEVFSNVDINGISEYLVGIFEATNSKLRVLK